MISCTPATDNMQDYKIALNACTAMHTSSTFACHGHVHSVYIINKAAGCTFVIILCKSQFRGYYKSMKILIL